jgi:hypothetical protein
MTDQKKKPTEAELATTKANDRREQRMMWIFSGAIVLLILGAMGANMLFHKGGSGFPENTDVSAQSRTAPSK